LSRDDALVAARAARLAPLQRSARLSLQVSPGWLWWGATWAVTCGAAAAWPWPAGASSLARLGAVWFVSVVLLGALWTEALAAADSTEHRRDQMSDAAWPAELVIALAALAVGALLGTGVALIALITVVASLALRRRQSALPTGALRSAFEIAMPAAVAWLALGGPVDPPAALAAAEGPTWATWRWLADNGAFLCVLAAFSVIHHGATTAVRRRALDRRWWELVIGYTAAIAVLVWGAHALGAALVAVVFVSQWPQQAAMRSGRVLWHLRQVQWLSMAAMLIASLAV
jgi:hypothetical protein